MKLLLFLLLTITSVQASRRDCYRQITQADKNECMMYEKDRAIGRFMATLTKKCAGRPEVKEASGGTLQSMLLDECLIEELNEMEKEASHKD